MNRASSSLTRLRQASSTQRVVGAYKPFITKRAQHSFQATARQISHVTQAIDISREAATAIGITKTISPVIGSSLSTSLGSSSISSSSSSSSSSIHQDMSSTLSLANIRAALIRQEDTIIFNFIERAQFSLNSAAYRPDDIPVPAFDPSGRRYSLLEYVLRETEQLHGSVRRYTSPDEHAFYPEAIPHLVLPPITFPTVLAPCAARVNINSTIMTAYLGKILPGIAAAGDDNNHGSAVTLDVLVLQALSKRIHYGKFVAEAKFRADPEGYTKLIKARDADAIMALLTDISVERKVIERVRLKAATFGQDISSSPPPSPPPSLAAGSTGKCGVVPDLTVSTDTCRYKVSPDVVAAVYEELVMPLTKEVEVQYLLQRLDD